MSPTTNTTALDQLAELKAEVARAKHAEQVAHAEQAGLQRAVADAREAVRAAYAAGNEAAQKAAHSQLERAQKAADSATASHQARAEGLAHARARAQAQVNTYCEQHLADLIEDLRPDAQAAVAAVHTAITALQSALAAYQAVDRRVSEITIPIRWFKPHERMPSDVFAGLRSALNAIAKTEIPEPLPVSVLDPAAEDARIEAMLEQQRHERRQAWRPFGKAAA